MKDPNWRRCVLNADSRDIIKRIPDHSIDFILTDPPYNLAKHSTGNIPLPGRTAINNDLSEWDLVDFNPEEWADEFIRILKPTGNLFIFTSFNQIGRWYNCLDHKFDASNFMIWHKTDPAPKIYKAGFLNSCEMIFTCWNKKHTWHFSSQSEMHNFIESGVCKAPERLKKPKHPTQKPVSILKRMIEMASNENDIIFDPFMGVGSTGVAAMELGRRFIGVELDKEYYEAALLRIAKASSDDGAFCLNTPPLELNKSVVVPENTSSLFFNKQEKPEKAMVLMNYAPQATIALMIEKGLCYIRAGNADGSILVTPDFEGLQYVCLHSSKGPAQIFRIKNNGAFKVWTKESLKACGFHPSHAQYYTVFPFDNSEVIIPDKLPQHRSQDNKCCAKMRPLSDFIDF